MNRITRIQRLRNHVIFRDFSWPKNLPDFGRYNLIYGWNGTGKTTLSRLFRNLEQGKQPTTGEVVLCTNGRNIKGEEFPQESFQVRVFNRDFVQENVFPVDGGDLPPIFILGAKSVEKQKEIDRLKNELSTAQGNLETASFTKQTLEKHFNKFCVDSAKVIKDTLLSSNNSPYNNYNKSNFEDDAQAMAEANDGTTQRLDEEERKRLLSQHRSTLESQIGEVNYTMPDFRAVINSLSELLNKTVISEALEALKNDPELAAWILQGLRIYQSRSIEQCLFCEQPMPKKRLVAIEAHFNDQYEQFIQRVDQEITKLKEKSETLANLQLPPKEALYENIRHEFDSANTELKANLKSVQTFLDDAVGALKDKKHRFFEPVKLELALPSAEADAVDKLNTAIRKHNRVCDDFRALTRVARDKLANDMIAAYLVEFVHQRDAVESASTDVRTKEQEVQHLNDEINKLEQEIVQHHQPAEELSEDLHHYLGHQELRLKIKDTGYAITRSGEPAESLSEGERTAIALLYFLKSLKDRQFDLSKGVIVLDDPVSSLDANALFLAFGFIRKRTEGAGQLFVLTHNFSFFRQVRNWFGHLQGQNNNDSSKRPAQFFMLDCAQDQSVRCTGIRKLDPLLEQYDSEYQYLFARVYRASENMEARGLEQNYVLPNMARRLLEAFLAFRQPHISGTLRLKLQEVSFNEVKKLRILRFLNTHSHGISVEEPGHDLTALAEGPAVLKDLLDMIKSLDNEHFSAMVQLITQQTDS